MAVKFQHRGDTAANWTSVNPVLSSRELGLETDTGKMKFGDGTTAWVSLAYAVAGNVTGQASSVDSEIALFSGTGGKTIKRATGSGVPLLTSGVLSISNLDNTSDANKPVSTAQQTALDLKSPLASPTFTGTVTLPDGTVSLAKMANMATASLIYRKTAGTGVPEVNTLATLKTDLALVKADVGLSSVDNTADTAKPVSTAQQTALNLKADLASPTFSGTPSLPTGTTATTQSPADSTTKLATTAFVTTADNLKAPLASPAFTGTPTGITATHVGLGNVTNESKATMFTSPTLTGTPVLGAANATSIAATGALTSSGGGIGYATGAGGTGSQATSRTTTVTLNKLCGTFTMFSAAQAADALVTFTFSNSFIAAGDFVQIQHNSATNGGAWNISVVPGAGSCTVNIRNVSNASITEATPLRFFVNKGVTA